jgi:hypothetical protein
MMMSKETGEVVLGDRSILTAEESDATMCKFKRQEPFLPFVVEMIDGRSILVKWPNIAINGGGATLITPDWDFVDFECEQVRSIHSFASESSLQRVSVR